MNRALLLENLPDLLEELDARLTALEANQDNRPIHPSLAELRAQYDAEELRRALRHVRGLLAGGRTVGHDWQKAALDAENFILNLLGAPGQPPKLSDPRPMALYLETMLDEAQADVERQADEIKRLEAVCDDLSDKLDAANEIIAALKAT